MSGSGGYYKYRCKYWLTYNCPNWVWVNNAPCAHCLADGRDLEVDMVSGPFRISREVYVPQLENGSFHYTLMQIIAASDVDSGWAVKDTSTQVFPISTGPSAVSITAFDGLDTRGVSRSGLPPHTEAQSWPRIGVSVA